MGLVQNASTAYAPHTSREKGIFLLLGTPVVVVVQVPDTSPRYAAGFCIMYNLSLLEIMCLDDKVAYCCKALALDRCEERVVESVGRTIINSCEHESVDDLIQ